MQPLGKYVSEQFLEHNKKKNPRNQFKLQKPQLGQLQTTKKQQKTQQMRLL